MAVSFICGENQSTQRKPLTCCIEYTSPWTGFELTISVVIGTDWTGSCKSNYYTTTATTAPYFTLKLIQCTTVLPVIYGFHWLFVIVWNMYTREIHIGIRKKKKIPTNVQWNTNQCTIKYQLMNNKIPTNVQ